MTPQLRVIHGCPDETEVAAVAVVLLTLIQGRPSPRPKRRPAPWTPDGDFHPPGDWAA
jgi:hypothetical protein